MEWWPVAGGGLYDAQLQHVVKLLMSNLEAFGAQAARTARQWRAGGLNVVSQVISFGGLQSTGLCQREKFCLYVGVDGLWLAR